MGQQEPPERIGGAGQPEQERFMEMKECFDCDAPSDRGMFCQRCDQVNAVMGLVIPVWRTPDELGQLRDRLRQPFFGLRQEVKEMNAPLLQKVINRVVIIAGGDPAKIEMHPQADELAGRVATAISKRLAGLDEIQRFEAKEGQGVWNDRASNLMEGLKAMLAKKFEAQARR